MQYNNYAQTPLGLMLWNAHSSPYCSSTRAELAAAIHALSAPGPTHIASDSQAFCRKANEILANPEQHPRRPWGLQPDGDLWQNFYQCATSKGVEAVRITWVKGHATDDHVAQGITTDTHRKGNDAADKCADFGVAAFGPDLQELCATYLWRHVRYVKLVKGILQMFVRVFKADAELRAKKEKNEPYTQSQEQNLTAIPANGLKYADNNLARKFHTQDPLPKPDNLRHIHQSYYTDLYNFIETLEVQPIQRDTSGVTWLELFILFQLRGGWKHDMEEESQLITKLSTKAATKQFQHAMKKVANMHLDDADLTLFRSATTTQLRLKPLGFTNHMPKLSFLPKVVEEEATLIAQALLSMRAKFTTTMRDQLLQDTLLLKPCKLSLRSKPRWHKIIPREANLTETRLHINTRIANTQQTHNTARAAGLSLALHCPSCDKAREVALNPFRNGNWQPAHCSRCSKAWGIKLWRCSCNKNWRLCQRHSAVAGALPTSPPPKPARHPPCGTTPPQPKRTWTEARPGVELGASQSRQTKRGAPQSRHGQMAKRQKTAQLDAEAISAIDRMRIARA